MPKICLEKVPAFHGSENDEKFISRMNNALSSEVTKNASLGLMGSNNKTSADRTQSDF